MSDEAVECASELPTSAIRIRRNALAIEASTPTKSKSMDLFDSRLTATVRPCLSDA